VVSRRNADITDTLHLRDVASICVKSAVKPQPANLISITKKIISYTYKNVAWQLWLRDLHEYCSVH